MGKRVLLCIAVAMAFTSLLPFAYAADPLVGMKQLAYEAGHGNVRSLTQLRREADSGLPAAQKYLGDLYKRGEGISKDYAKAVEWYRRAGSNGFASAQAELGFLYYKGQGVPQDFSQAALWWKKASEQGDAAAQSNLGVLYYKGQGVSQDFSQAAKLWLGAAEQGDAPSQYNIGFVYFKGRGVPRDYVEAYKWLSLSASHLHDRRLHDSAVAARNIVEQLMTSEQLANAKQLLKSWSRNP